MRCIEPPSGAGAVRHAVTLLLAGMAALATGCSPAPEAAAPGTADAPKTARDAGGPAAGRATPASRPAPAIPVPAPARPGLADRSRGWDDYRRRAAERIVALNPGATYDGAVPEPLLAIPVLEIELAADGSVRHIQVLREPGQARDTVDLAIAAVRRAAPFGPVTHLPAPWSFTETFLFDDQRRFKPRTLDV